VTLVGVPDAPLVAEDALLDVDARSGDRVVPFAEIVARARAGDPFADVRLVGGGLRTRPHLYSRASLEPSATAGWIDAAERAGLAEAMGAVERVFGEPRAAIAQATTCSPAAWAALPAHAAALEAIGVRTGLVHPAALLALPYGNLPLTGVRRYDDELARTFTPPAASAVRQAEAAR
jgi:hypothetical protein